MDGIMLDRNLGCYHSLPVRAGKVCRGDGRHLGKAGWLYSRWIYTVLYRSRRPHSFGLFSPPPPGSKLVFAWLL